MIVVTTPAYTPENFYTAGGISRTYIASGSERWESETTELIPLPGAKVEPTVGGPDAPSYGAISVATFTAETLSEADDDNNVLTLDIEFDGVSGNPLDSEKNYRFASTRPSGPGEWSSHTTIRHFRVAPRMNLGTVPIQVKVSNGRNAAERKGRLGVQNWTLRVDRYNI
ncbi:hypothetical protein [Streptomyces tsukubensis]|uniref:Uncharacterized protein n=1 Tax=Streptomyces tsukubensis TaxID=83656 RepID=A0A1V4A5W9_9ACTN|nr:hypothetical protein [Streptomyces tsukubensis]OON77009.1 hypothetical protein B1H18_19925 [Streptomyces tsukubensis]QFR93752.1 hypothetical protein GBW32_12570 [Streptomyces tsukubensis]